MLPLKRSGSYTGTEAAELAADQAEKSNHHASKQINRPDTAESSNEDTIVPRTLPLRPANPRWDHHNLSHMDSRASPRPPDLIPTLISELEDSPEPAI
jgi:hypothetical protein